MPCSCMVEWFQLHAGRRSRHRRISSLDEKTERRSMMDPALISPASSGELSVSRAKVDSILDVLCVCGEGAGMGGASGAKAAVGCLSCHRAHANSLVISSPTISYKRFPAPLHLLTTSFSVPLLTMQLGQCY